MGPRGRFRGRDRGGLRRGEPRVRSHAVGVRRNGRADFDAVLSPLGTKQGQRCWLADGVHVRSPQGVGRRHRHSQDPDFYAELGAGRSAPGERSCRLRWHQGHPVACTVGRCCAGDCRRQDHRHRLATRRSTMAQRSKRIGHTAIAHRAASLCGVRRACPTPGGALSSRLKLGTAAPLTAPLSSATATRLGPAQTARSRSPGIRATSASRNVPCSARLPAHVVRRRSAARNPA